MMNSDEYKYDEYKYDKVGNKSHLLSRGLPQMQLKGLMSGCYVWDGKGIWEPTPGNITQENGPYVRYQDESKPKVKMSSQKRWLPHTQLHKDRVEQKDGHHMLPTAHSPKDKGQKDGCCMLIQRQRRTTMATVHWFSC